MKSFFKIKYLLVLVAVFASCGIEDLNFEQVNNYSAVRVFNTTLVYFTADNNDFLDNSGTEILTPVGDEAGFLFLINNPSLRSNLVKFEVEVEINNQFNREFIGRIQFFNKNGFLTQEFEDLNILPTTTNYKNTFTLTVADNTNFLNSTKVRLEVELQPSNNGTVISPADQETLNFKSVGIYHIKGNIK